MRKEIRKSERCRQRLCKAIDEDKSYDERMMRLNKLFKALEKENEVEIFGADVSKFGYGFVEKLEELCQMFKEENALHRHMHEYVWQIIGMIDLYGANQKKKLA
jgi:hypothetical protein